MNYIDSLKEYENLEFIDYNKLKNKTILLTGATGLVGRFFVDLIMHLNNVKKLNCKIIGLSIDKKRAIEIFPYFDNPLFQFIEQNVCDKIEYDLGIDYIIHCASNTSPTQYVTNPIETININYVGTSNLLELAVAKKAKFVFISSFEVYGNVLDKDTIKETDYGYIDNLKLRSCYPESKRISENLCIAYSNEKGVETSILRLSRVFGPTMNPFSTLSISTFIRCGINKEDIVLKSDGNQKYSFNYVGDVVSAIIKVMLDGKNMEAYNVSSPNFNTTLRDFANIVASYVNKKVIYDIPSDIENKGFSNTTMTILDSSKLINLGWKTNKNIAERIKETIDMLR